MNWRWDWAWSILWNALIHAVTLQWGLLAGDGDALKSWWKSFWSEVENRVNGVRSWASGRISWLSGYAYGLYIQARDFINSQISSLRSWAQGRISYLSGYAYGLYIQARNWIDSQVASVRNFAQSLRDGLYNWARLYVDSAVNWVRSIYEWVRPYRDLITSWLMRAKGSIDWLVNHAIGQLQSFLRDPVDFVLGWLLNPVRNLVNWWQEYGPALMSFVAQELADLRTTWTNGKRILKALVNNPEQFVFDLLAPKFLDWFVGLIADNW